MQAIEWRIQLQYFYGHSEFRQKRGMFVRLNKFAQCHDVIANRHTHARRVTSGIHSRN